VEFDFKPKNNNWLAAVWDTIEVIYTGSMVNDEK